MSWLDRFLLWLRPTPAEQWRMAANAYYIDGYSDAEIVLILGPCPKDEV